MLPKLRMFTQSEFRSLRYQEMYLTELFCLFVKVSLSLCQSNLLLFFFLFYVMFQSTVLLSSFMEHTEHSQFRSRDASCLVCSTESSSRVWQLQCSYSRQDPWLVKSCMSQDKLSKSDTSVEHGVGCFLAS